MLRPFRKPLIIMAPKSLLRHKLAVSKAEDFLGETHFKRILSDPNGSADKDTRRLVLCSGKVFYDLMEARDAAGDTDVQIVRKIGRASCRERVCQYVEISVVAGPLKKKKTKSS